jgi:CelD/BcsL family acetyltransferase involved in cellulose biosynthesis
LTPDNSNATLVLTMYTVVRESFDGLAELRNTGKGLQWNSPFILPTWMKVWWQNFHPDGEPYLIVVRDEQQVIGIAPLQINDDIASLVGGDNVCDYLDFIIIPGQEDSFFNVIFDDLMKQHVKQLNLGLLRPDSIVMTKLTCVARNRGFKISSQQEDVSSEMALPSTFDEYLLVLNTKQRHEVRRKLRRLSEAGSIKYSFINGDTGLESSLDTFMSLFSLARDDKARFMTPEMAVFFHSLSHAMAEIGLLRFGLLEIDTNPAAMVMCFEYNNTIYLYNSGFDPQYDSFSVGLMSKVLTIRESMRRGNKRFEFLKGNEIYKERLGGQEIPLYRCKIDIP